MKEVFRQAYQKALKEKQVNGLWFGMLVGLGLALATWGWDAFLLFQAEAEYPWLKLVIGLPVYVCVAALVGWLTVKFDNTLLAFIAWLAVGVFFVYIASHVPYEGQSTLIGLLKPHFEGIQVYPFVQSAQVRMSLLYFLVGGLTAVVGALVQFFIVEAATRASVAMTRWSTLILAMVIFAPIGLLTDNLINQPLRLPVQGVNRLIQFGLQAEQHPVTKQQSREMGLRAVKSFGDLINHPYRLVLGYYDPESQSETSVYVRFDVDGKATWGNCFVMDGFPTFCQLSADLYIRRLYCLMEGGEESACRMKLGTGGKPLLDDLVEQVGTSPPANIFDQYGNSVLLTVFGTGQEQYQCSLDMVGNVYFQGCAPIQGRAYLPLQVPTPLVLEQTAVPGAIPGNANQPVLVSEQAILGELQDVPQYTLFLDLNMDTRSFSGQAKVEYTNNEEISLHELVFRLMPNGKGSFGDGSLTVREVLVNSQPASTSLSVENTVLRVDLPGSLGVGQKVQIDFLFDGRLAGEFGEKENAAGYGIYNYNQGVLALSAWYPMLAVHDRRGWNLSPASVIGDSIFSDTAFYTVTLKIKDDFRVATTGVEQSRELFGDTQRLVISSGPARDFFIVASPDFESVSREVDGTRVSVYYLPGHKLAGEQALSVAGESLHIFNRKFGAYPYTELDIMDAPMQYALGVEFPGIVLVSSALFETPEEATFAVTTAHEVSHQWWYNVVGNHVFEEPWLDEGLATYSSSLYYEFGPAGGVPAPLIAYWQDRYDKLVQAGQDEPLTRPLAYFEGLGNVKIYGVIAYSKGAIFFYELRQEIGDAAFFLALQNYYRTHQFQIATAQDLLDAFEAAAGRPLDSFYQKWVFAEAP